MQSLTFAPQSFLSCVCRCGYAFSGWVRTAAIEMPAHDCPLQQAADPAPTPVTE